LRKKISDRKKKQHNQNDQSSPPIDAPDWCLSTGALEELGRSTNNIPNYDPESDNDIEEYNDDEKSDDNRIHGERSDDKVSESPKRKKRKNKSHKQKKKGNKHKKQKNL
jgi:hypothetical protein